MESAYLTDMVVSDDPDSKDMEKDAQKIPPFEEKRQRFGHRQVTNMLAHLPLYSWAWNLMPLATLGLSILLSGQRSLHNFDGLYTIGLIVYFFGLVQYVAMLVAKSIHFTVIPGSFKESFETPEEVMLSASFWMGMYAVIAGAVDYSAPEPGSRLAETFFAIFWIYLVAAHSVSLTLHLLLFQEKRLEGGSMTPAWLLPILPVILVGVLAGVLADSLHPAQRYPVLLAGLYSWGLGFLMSIPTYSIYFWRLFTCGLPKLNSRPGMMIAVGPPTFAPLVRPA